jgi:hypothetical protein
MAARRAIRAVGAALGKDATRVDSVARQVPLLSCPCAIEDAMHDARARPSWDHSLNTAIARCGRRSRTCR